MDNNTVCGVCGRQKSEHTQQQSVQCTVDAMRKNPRPSELERKTMHGLEVLVRRAETKKRLAANKS